METRLSSLQQEVLEAFFQREKRFFLTGGAALAGYYLGHRTTEDLDFFTTEDCLAEASGHLLEIARDLGLEIEALRTSPDFRRYLVRRGDEAAVVDLVHDRAPQLFPDKRSVGRLRIDPPEEIVANKLCTLLSRAEIRDLVDLRALEQAGYRADTFVEMAQRKDGGLTPGQLAWVLSEVEIGDDAQIPGGVSAEELRTYVEQLQRRLAARAYPE